MARYGPPDPNYPDNEPTRYLPPVEEEVPWYRKPAALVAFGALGAVLIALIVYGLAKLISGDAPSAESTTLTPITRTTTSAPVLAPPQTRTVTETVTPTTTAPTTTTTTTTTTTEPTTSVSTSVSTSISTSTVTETITVPPGG